MHNLSGLRPKPQRADHFCRPLHVAMQDGPYLAHRNGPRRVVSEGSTRERATSLLIVRTGRIVTAGKAVAPDTRSFQHTARFY
jgi:hypothetical protein